MILSQENGETAKLQLQPKTTFLRTTLWMLKLNGVDVEPLSGQRDGHNQQSLHSALLSVTKFLYNIISRY